MTAHRTAPRRRAGNTRSEVHAIDSTAFAVRHLKPADVAFVVSSFAGSYSAAGQVGGVRDQFAARFFQPFAQLVESSSAEPGALVSTRVVYPIAEPTEVAGYAVTSPRHHALLYLLTKNAYQRRRVATHLLGELPTLTGDARDPRRYFHTVFSTADFSKMCKRLEIKTRHSPFLLLRVLEELAA